MNALLITNQASRDGDAVLQSGLELLYQDGWQIRRETPDGPDGIAVLIRKYGPSVERILLGGGDGTMNCAAEALMETQKPLGILPLGTANDLARTLQIPADLIEACRIIRDGHVHQIDLGCVNDQYFFNGASIGLGEQVTRKLSDEVKARWGVMAYCKAVIEAFKANRSFRVRLVSDGEEKQFSSIQVMVGNGRHYGGGMTIAEDAQVDNHEFCCHSIKPQRFLKLAALALALRQGRVSATDRVISWTSRELEIRTERAMAVDTDGEVTTRTPARFRVIRNAIKVCVPAEYQAERTAHAQE